MQKHLSARRTRRRGPLAEHLLQGASPLGLARSCEFVDTRRCRVSSTPHGRLRCQQSCVFLDETSAKLVVSIVARISKVTPFREIRVGQGYRSDSLVLYFGQYQPAVIPATSARGISDDLPFGLIQTL